MSEEEQVARVAWFYYHDNLTQNEIGNLLDLPRLKVSRLLEKGRKQGLIQVTINSRFEGCLCLEEKIKALFGLQDVRIIPDYDPTEANICHRVSIGAANLLMHHLVQGQLLAVGFGETIMATLKNLGRYLHTEGIDVVSLAGGVGSYMKGVAHLDASCRVNLVPAPLRASSAEVANILYNEPSVWDVLQSAITADVAVISIGSISQGDNATMFQSGYITQAEQKLLQRGGAQGDILGYFFNENGKVLEDEKIHQQMISTRPERLREIPYVVGVSGGQIKAEAILAALNGEFIDALVTNEATAIKIIQLAEKR
ncbi:sugar-binding domain-containing protein [Photobacterium nomapromontoriensis]|uniref:sugar-binding domain-containing protein n=1 Tax=Photobacterium nomapromontoriensis TaxID=2910237 RepID=UPI003D14F934